MSVSPVRQRTWMRGLQLLLSLIAAGLLLALVFWVAVSVYYVTQLARGGTDVTVGASLPNGRLLGLDTDVPGLVPGTSLSSGGELAIAVRDPGPAEYGLAALQHLPTLAVYTVFFVLLLRWVRVTDETGPFRAARARQARFLGAYLVLGSLLAALVEATAQGLLARLVLVDGRFVFDYDFPTGALVGGVGLLAAAEILHRGVQLREDLEGIV